MHLRLRKCDQIANLFAVAEHFLQFCGTCGIECKFAVSSSADQM